MLSLEAPWKKDDDIVIHLCRIIGRLVGEQSLLTNLCTRIGVAFSFMYGGKPRPKGLDGEGLWVGRKT